VTVAALTTAEIAALVIVVILGIITAAILLYMAKRLRARRDKLRSELSTKPELAQDRAFNRLAMARREAELLGRQGTDVGRAQELIAQAQGAFDTRQFERAYELAQQAHESLVIARQSRAPLPAAAVPLASSASVPTTVPAAGTTSPAPSSNIPKNRAESQFQLRLLDQELDAAGKGGRSSSGLSGATQLRLDAQAAFDRSDFTNAFRLALKGRRALGAPVESLPAVGPAATGGSDGGRVVDPDATAEIAASAERCPSCGYPALPGDAFCRGCGKPRGPTVCAKCGAPRTQSDTFCGKCGAPFS
jgi:hypothetical protein